MELINPTYIQNLAIVPIKFTELHFFLFVRSVEMNLKSKHVLQNTFPVAVSLVDLTKTLKGPDI